MEEWKTEWAHATVVTGGEFMGMVGSTYMFGVGADIDFVVYAQPGARIPEGYVPCVGDDDSYDGARPFAAYRKGQYNLLLCYERDYAERWLTAAEVCKLLQLEDKGQRIAVHRVIMDNHSATEAQEYVRLLRMGH